MPRILSGLPGKVKHGLRKSIGNVAVQTDGAIISLDDGNVIRKVKSIDEVESNILITKDQAFDRIGAAARSTLNQTERNLHQARKESNQFFKLTLVFSILGFLILMDGAILLLIGQVTAGIVTSISSTLSEITAGLIYKKDNDLRKTIENYHLSIY